MIKMAGLIAVALSILPLMHIDYIYERNSRIIQIAMMKFVFIV